MTKLYWFPLSPPARLVYFFSVAANIPLETVTVDLGKGEQKSPEFLAVNPNGQVPALKEDDGFTVFESAAIIRYLAAKHPNDVFPTKDPKAQAQIDEYAELVKSKLTLMGQYVFHSVIRKKFFGQDGDPVLIKQAEESLAAGFASLENVAFKDCHHHVTGKSLSLADVILGTYLSQLELAKFDLKPYPKTQHYFEHLKHVDAFVKGHAQFNEVLKHLQ